MFLKLHSLHFLDDDSDADSDDEDDTAELLAELNRIKKERAVEMVNSITATADLVFKPWFFNLG